MENTQQEAKQPQTIPVPPPPLPPPDLRPANATPNLNISNPSANHLAVFMIIGVFVLMLLAGLLIAIGPFKKDQKDKLDVATEAKTVVGTNTTTVPKSQDTKANSEVNAKDNIPQFDSPSSAASVPLTSDNLAFDVDGDGKLTLKDILAVAGFVDSQQYSALYDFDSNARVDVLDLAEIRSEFIGYPVAEFDVNGDGRLNVTDVLSVSGFVDSQQYSALYDFNSDARIDVKDLALIRSAVATAGTVSGSPMR